MKGIALIGPVNVGKTTQGALLAEATGLPRCSIDEIDGDSFREAGFDEDFHAWLSSVGGFWAAYMYRKAFYGYAVERTLEAHPGHIVDFDAGHSVLVTAPERERVRRALQSCHTVLLLPARDRNASIQFRHDTRPDLRNDVKEHHFIPPSNAERADITVYTERRTPEAVRDEILASWDEDR